MTRLPPVLQSCRSTCSWLWKTQPPVSTWTRKSSRGTPSWSWHSEARIRRPGSEGRSRRHAFSQVVGCKPDALTPQQGVLQEDTQGDFPTLHPRCSQAIF